VAEERLLRGAASLIKARRGLNVFSQGGRPPPFSCL